MTFEPGDSVIIRTGTIHANTFRLSLFDSDDRDKRFKGRKATFVRYMAGGDIAIVDAEEWGISPAQMLRVDVNSLRAYTHPTG